MFFQDLGKATKIRVTGESDFRSTFLSLPVKSLVLNSERSYREDSKSERHLSTFFGSNLNNNGLEICP